MALGRQEARSFDENVLASAERLIRFICHVRGGGIPGITNRQKWLCGESIVGMKLIVMPAPQLPSAKRYELLRALACYVYEILADDDL